MTSAQKRVMLWAVPRSLSSAMCRVMMNSSYNTKIIFEPFVDAYYFGPDRVSSRYASQPPDVSKSYSDVKQRLEQPYEDYGLVFVKDVAYAVSPGLALSRLPEGYVHTFLIRHPREALISFYTLINSGILPDWTGFDPAECGYKEQVELSRLLLHQGHKMIVIDADDLKAKPESVLRAYCDEVGLTFSDSMLNWAPITPAQLAQTFGDWPKEWFGRLLTSTTILNTSNNATSIRDDSGKDGSESSTKPEELRRAIEDAVPYYEEMYAMRLRP